MEIKEDSRMVEEKADEKMKRLKSLAIVLTWQDLFILVVGKMLMTIKTRKKNRLVVIFLVFLLILVSVNLYFNDINKHIVVPGAYIDSTVFTNLPSHDDHVNALSVRDISIDSLGKQLYMYFKYGKYYRYLSEINPPLDYVGVNPRRIGIGEDIYNMQLSAYLAVHKFMGDNKPYTIKLLVESVGAPEHGLPTILPADTILEVDGVEVTDMRGIEKYLLEPIKRQVKVLRGEKSLYLDTTLAGVRVKEVIQLTDIGDYEDFYRFANLGLQGYKGSSAGSALALEYYNSMVEDIVKGRNIALTGTISPEGEIGEVAGVKQKTLLAIENDAEILFIPRDSNRAENYTEALGIVKDTGSTLKLIVVDNFSDIVHYLKE